MLTQRVTRRNFLQIARTEKTIHIILSYGVTLFVFPDFYLSSDWFEYKIIRQKGQGILFVQVVKMSFLFHFIPGKCLKNGNGR